MRWESETQHQKYQTHQPKVKLSKTQKLINQEESCKKYLKNKNNKRKKKKNHLFCRQKNEPNEREVYRK